MVTDVHLPASNCVTDHTTPDRNPVKLQCNAAKINGLYSTVTCD